MKKVLITGAGGFIGSHLTEFLVKQGYTVKAFLRYNSRNHWGWLENSEIKNEIQVVAGDIRDYDSVYNALTDCEAVFHLAALIGIPYSYVSPLAYIKTNIEGTYNVLEASRKIGLKEVLITSTSETYGTAQFVPINENHPLVGQSPYSASKIGADELAISYYRSFRTPVKIVRPFNTYGPRQSARAVIPTIMSQIISGVTDIKLGNISPTRDLTYVADTVSGFYEIFKSNLLYGEATNIGMNHEISIGNLATLIAGVCGKKINIVTEEKRTRPDNSEVERLVCDNSRIIEKTGWTPQYDLKRGLESTYTWLAGHSHLYKHDLYNV